MAGPHKTPPRFVPTLTDVVHMPAEGPPVVVQLEPAPAPPQAQAQALQASPASPSLPDRVVDDGQPRHF